MPLKFLHSDGYGNVADAIACIDYATDNGARVMNNSWGGGYYSEGLRLAVARAENADVVVDAVVSPVSPATMEELDSIAKISNHPKPDGAAADAAARGEDVVVGEVTALSSSIVIFSLVWVSKKPSRQNITGRRTRSSSPIRKA